jgi:TrmH family RNA methyltransferase
MGTMFWKPFYSHSFIEFMAWIKKHNVRLIGTSAHGTGDYRQVHLDARPSVLLLGSEQKGLQPDQLSVCDDLVSLPMEGRATSLNLAVAAGIFMYTLRK